MPRFETYDGISLAYHSIGNGRPLLCIPGGPGRASEYLGDLGGLSATRQLVCLDIRGTGESEVPGDSSTYRCDRLVEDVEAMRIHLALDRMDLLGHSAGGGVALQYAATYPERVDRLVLITPSMLPVGISVTDEEARAKLEQRSGEPWYAEARAALSAWIEQGEASPEIRLSASPFFYGRWDDEIAVHAAADLDQVNPEVRTVFQRESTYEPDKARSALAGLVAPVLVLVGGADPSPTPRMAEELVSALPRGEAVVQPGAGHYPWLDDGEWFVSTVAGFLDGPGAE